ncbi:MAG: serine hydrolase [Pseudomonadota bacterium]
MKPKIRQKALLLLCAALFSAEFAFARTDFDAQEIEALADEYFNEALAQKRMTGASVGFVQDGEVVFLKAYGWEDQAKSIPLDPRRTRFRMCSTSKTVTATALMQLVERGQIESLDDPVNRYLKRYQLPPPYGDDVSFRQLMTHSSGMAGHATPQGTKKDMPVPVAAEEVQWMFRENIERPPGAIGQYANLGVALEGVAIEDITGTSLAVYIGEEIFAPLGMNSALFHHSLEKPPHLAQPYAIYPDGSLQEIRFYPKHPLTAASGGFITTTEDMLKYVAFHADESATAFADVLSSTGKQTLHARHFGRHPSDPGMGLHFYRDYYGDELMVSHGCGLPGTSSLMGVLPQSNAGFAMTVLKASVTPTVGDLLAKVIGKGRLVANGQGPDEEAEARGAFLPSAVLGDKTFPPADWSDVPSEMVSDHASLPGTYWSERRAFKSYAKLFALSTTQVALGKSEGELILNDRTYVRLAPGVYEDREKPNRIYFQQAESDGTIYMQPHVSFALQRVSGIANPIFSFSGLALSLVVSFMGVIALAWRCGKPAERYSRWLSVAMAMSVVSLLVVFLAGYERIADIAYIDYLNGDTTRTILLIAVFNLHFAVGLCVIIAAILAWKGRLFGSGWKATAIRLHLSLLALAAIAGWPAMFMLNLIGLQQ